MSVSTVTQRPSSGSAVLAAVCLAAVILPLSFSAGAIAPACDDA